MRLRLRAARLYAALVLVTTSVPPAFGEGRITQRVVLESYAGQRPDWAVRPVTQLRILLEKRRYLSNPRELAKRMFGTAVLTPAADPKFSIRAFSRQVQQGLQRVVVDENYPAAIHILAEALRGVDRNPVLLCQNARLRELKFDALVYLARAYHYQGDRMAERDEIMTEVIRSYPSRPVAGTKYGPDALKIYNDVKAAIDKLGTSKLSVRVTDDPGAVVCIDDVIQNGNSPASAQVIPGPHKIVITGSSDESRQLSITTRPKSTESVVIPWDLHSVLVTGDYFGFRFATTADREREGMLALKLIGTYTSTVIVTVLSARLEKRRVVVSGTVHGLSGDKGQQVRRAEVVLDGKKDNDKLGQLAAYLGYDEAEKGPDVYQLDIDPTPVRWAPEEIRVANNPGAQENRVAKNPDAQENRVAKNPGAVFDPNQLFPTETASSPAVARSPQPAPSAEPSSATKPILLIVGGGCTLAASGIVFYRREIDEQKGAWQRPTWITVGIASTAVLGVGLSRLKRHLYPQAVVSVVPTRGGAFGHFSLSF